jgi:hypothetical protein
MRDAWQTRLTVGNADEDRGSMRIQVTQLLVRARRAG